ncbi:dynein heavy chain [Paecilomyces lecythidis]|uniref:Dynein heavy chain n=1 Tax=Paecilomyces lecythidis TaxID=3004212 RepID=A0ABR3XGD6_9EURO
MGRPRLHDGRPNALSASSPSPAASLYQSSTKVLRETNLGDRIPAFHIPLAFLSSLRANLQISSREDLYHSSTPPSVTNTPDALCPVVSIPSQSLPSPSPFLISKDIPDVPSIEPDIQPPPSSLYSIQTAGTEDEKTGALRLIADSVLEQRFVAARALFLHPVILCLILLVHAVVARWLFRRPYNTVLVAFGYTVCILAMVFAMTYLSREYGYLATQSETREWLIQPHRARHPPSSSNSKSLPEDDILVAKYGSEVVGALVFRIARTRAFMTAPPSTSGFTRGHRRRSSHSSSARLTGVVRAWTVKTNYRHRGIGTDLLRQAVEMCRRRRLDGPVFADDHAYSVRVLPRIFNTVFEKRDERAKDLLTDIIEEEC